MKGIYQGFEIMAIGEKSFLATEDDIPVADNYFNFQSIYCNAKVNYNRDYYEPFFMIKTQLKVEYVSGDIQRI